MNFDKRKLWLYTIKELKHFVHNLHVFSVISILIDEIKKDLLAGKEIKIINFGTFKIKQTKPRNYKDVVTNNIEVSKVKNKLEFKLTPKLAKHISESIDKELKDEQHRNDIRE